MGNPSIAWSAALEVERIDLQDALVHTLLVVGEPRYPRAAARCWVGSARSSPEVTAGKPSSATLSKILGRPNAEPASCMFSRNIVCLSRARTFREGTLKIRQNFRDAPHRCDL